MLVDLTVFQHRLFLNKRLKPTNTMKRNKGILAPQQAGIEDFKGVFQEQIRTMVRNGLLDLIAQEVTDLCGRSQQPDGGIYRRAGTELVTVRTISGKETIAKLSYKHKRGFVELMNVLRGVQGKAAGEEAFDGVLKFVKERNFAAYEALSARRDGIMAFHRLNVPATLNVTFLSTNHIENVMGNARGTIGRICRWHDETNQVARWMGVALLRAQSGFRRVRGHQQLTELVTALARR